jgi:hypothetical protein
MVAAIACALVAVATMILAPPSRCSSAAGSPTVLSKQTFDLATCRFVERHETVLIQGPAGVGKSHLAQALGHEACRRGFDVAFVSAARMLGQTTRRCAYTSVT